MNRGRKECTFLWYIENYSYLRHLSGNLLCSSSFDFEGLEGTSWILVLFPKGCADEGCTDMSLFLRREYTDCGPKLFTIKYELSLLSANGSVLHSRESENTFERFETRGFDKFVQRVKIHLRRKADYLPNDLLTVRCKIWRGEGDVQKAEQISARTRIIVEHFSFFHIVEGFSTLQPNVKKTTEIRSHLVDGSAVSSSLYYTDGGEEKIRIEIASRDEDQILCKSKLSLLDNFRNITEYGEIENAYDNMIDDDQVKMHRLSLSITRDDILNKKEEYLSDDKLSLLCECTLFTGLEFHTIEEARHEVPSTVIKQKSNLTSALEDMKALYISQRLTDIELKTGTKSFPAHKIVLCARSPVFEAMLTSDMKEKISGCIHVDDLENDTVQQLLLFLYSDDLEPLQWESATQLYYAADKYQVGKLKAICSSFLSENLSISNVIELLVLAETHNDSHIMEVAEDFIVKHEEQVYTSKGWEKLKETHPQLVIKIMCLKYERKKLK